MDRDTGVKVAVYGFVAETGRVPTPSDLRERIGIDESELREAYAALRQRRLLLLEADGLTIRMAPPFSGVPTQHLVRSEGVAYFANCAWDALGIPAALKRPGEVESRCEQSRAPLRLRVGTDGPEACDWWFHCEVPASRWWQDLVHT